MFAFSSLDPLCGHDHGSLSREVGLIGPVLDSSLILAPHMSGLAYRFIVRREPGACTVLNCGQLESFGLFSRTFW
jgi:hypothetical protein